MKERLRYLLGLGLAVIGAACLAASAAATPMRSALSSVPFVQISDAASRQSPICPNGLVCYSPSLIRQAYDFPAGAGAPTGAGQTILVVEAYGSPTIKDDLAQFDAENGLPAPPSFSIVPQQTQVTDEGSGDLFRWAIETSLDVQYARAMAPGASIVLAVAATDSSLNIGELEEEVLPVYPGAIVSQSFGQDDSGANSDPGLPGEFEPLYAAAIAHGGTILASSGDYGATNLTTFTVPTPMASYPASSPLVLAVGGTQGKSANGLWHLPGKYGGEQVWNEITPTIFPGAGASGGAPSTVFPAPPWQQGLTGYSTRAEPDVAYNAAVNGGVIIVFGGRHGVVGGTSAGAPQWAAIVALANELRGRQAKPPLGLVAPALYALARDTRLYHQDFHDIVIGDNALAEVLPGFSARPGYDLPTGLGTPDVGQLVPDLAATDAPAGQPAPAAARSGKHQGHVRLNPGG